MRTIFTPIPPRGTLLLSILTEAMPGTRKKHFILQSFSNLPRYFFLVPGNIDNSKVPLGGIGMKISLNWQNGIGKGITCASFSKIARFFLVPDTASVKIDKRKVPHRGIAGKMNIIWQKGIGMFITKPNY